MTAVHALSELGQRIAEDGPAAHHELLLALSHLAHPVSPGAAAVLADPSAPPVARARAVAVATAALQRHPALVTAAA